jgi:hypothetical protein
MAVPRVSYAIVCEDVRLEQGNKLTVLGLYGILPSAAPKLHIVVPTWPASIRLLFMVGMSNGSAMAAANIINPDKSILASIDSLEIVEVPGDVEGVHRGFGFMPLTFEQQGQHFFQLLFDGVEAFNQPFTVSHGQIPTYSPSASPSSSPSSSASPSASPSAS